MREFLVKDALTTRVCTRCDCKKLSPMMRFLDWLDVQIAYELACNYTYDELANHLPHMELWTRRREML